MPNPNDKAKASGDVHPPEFESNKPQKHKNHEPRPEAADEDGLEEV